MTTRLYISGPMTGITNHNAEAFAEAARSLRAAGYSIISPSEMNGQKELLWEEYLQNDLQLLFHCDGIALLPGWETSQGANLELYNAIKLKKFVIDAVSHKPLVARVVLFEMAVHEATLVKPGANVIQH